MNCLRCAAPIDLSKTACPACGEPVDADGDGVPDVLSKMIEDKARALMAAEKQRETDEAEAAARAIRAQAQSAEREAAVQRIAVLRHTLQREQRSPRWRISPAAAIAAAALAALFNALCGADPVPWMLAETAAVFLLTFALGQLVATRLRTVMIRGRRRGMLNEIQVIEDRYGLGARTPPDAPFR